jgi:MEMO1 family protein
MEDTNNTSKIREPLVSGIFYPSLKDQLYTEISSLLNEQTQYSDNAFALISPHACLDYAGSIMAAAYQSASKRKINTVVILAPMHRNDHDEIILPESDFFETPLGLVKINHEIIEELLSCSNSIIKNDIPHLEEHCIEIQLPFIQVLFPDADIVPVLMSKSKPGNVKVLSNALQLTLNEKYKDILFAISANIGYCTKREKTTEKEAELFTKLLLEKDKEGIQKAISENRVSTCGADCISAVLSFKNINYDIKLLKKDNSATKDPDGKSVVYYAAFSLKFKK